MLKPASLRKSLGDAASVLHNNPDMLRIFIDSGKIAATLATSLSFENQYTLNIVVTDYHGDLDYLIVPLNAWLRENQPDIMTTDEGRRKGFTYIIADINDDESVDVSISLMLRDKPSSLGVFIIYDARPLLGFSTHEKVMISQTLIDALDN